MFGISETVIFGLVVWRVARLISVDEIFGLVRGMFGIETIYGDMVVLKTKDGIRGRIAYVLTCMYCLSVWIAGAVCILFYNGSSAMELFLNTMAVSAVAMMVNSFIEGRT